MTTAEDVVRSLNHIADVLIDDNGNARIGDYSPDSSQPEYSITEPGSAWAEECKRLLAEIRDSLPVGWDADWSDDDVIISRST